MKNLDQFKAMLNNPEHRFAQTLEFIQQYYTYQPTFFSYGDLQNESGTNEGSCKILALAILENLTQEQALLAFGEHYRQMLIKPDCPHHLNLGQLMRSGLKELNFATFPLQRKALNNSY